MKLIYLDTPLIRALSDNPITWDKLYDQFITIFGRSFKPIKSYYLLFEYLGFTKKILEIPQVLLQPHFDDISKILTINLKRGATQEEVSILDKNLSEIEAGIGIYLKQKLYSLKSNFEGLINERRKRVSSFKAAQELVNALFGDIFHLIETDFPEFVKQATTYLTWDSFCTIRPLKIPLKIIRDRQLSFWLHGWMAGIKLPVGKIIDDQASYYKLNFSSNFKEFEDMVDSEMHTLLILGYEISSQLHSIHCLTYPPKDSYAIAKRNELMLGTINNIQKTLGKEIPKIPGKIYSIDEKTHRFIEMNEPMFLINL